MTDYLLSDESIKKLTDGIYTDIPLTKVVAKAQAKHLLEQLEKEGLLHHTVIPIFDEGVIVGRECTEDCRACAALREVGI